VARLSRVLALCGLLIAWAPVPAAAEWQLAPFVGVTFAGGTNLYDPDSLNAAGQRHWNLGGAVRLLGAGPVGLEAIALYVPGFFEPSDRTPLFPGTPPSVTITQSHAFALMGNVVLTTPRAWNEYGLRPFVSGGLGLLKAAHNDAVFPVKANLLGYNVGGGAVGFLTDRVGVRFDMRYYRHVPPGPEVGGNTPAIGDRVRLHHWSATVGVVFKY
jgi:hypothetical protein